MAHEQDAPDDAGKTGQHVSGASAEIPSTGASRRRFIAAAAAACVPGGLRAAEFQAVLRAWPAGRPTPPLSLPAHDGPPWNLAAARGRPVLLNFWATWCEPCRSEMPSLELLAQRHESDGLQVMAVNYRENEAAIRRYLAQWPISLPILRDGGGQAAREWGVRVFPTTVLVARDGRAVSTVVGGVDWTGPEARRWMDDLLRRA